MIKCALILPVRVKHIYIIMMERNALCQTVHSRSLDESINAK